MLVVFSACHKDFEGCLRLLNWCAELQPEYGNHRALLVLSSQIVDAQREQLVSALNACRFASVSAIKQKEVDEAGWPRSANKMFALAANYVEVALRCPFFWAESDLTPLSSGWLDAIESDYVKGGRPYMGFEYDLVSPTRRIKHMTGCGVYPANIRKYNPWSLSAHQIPFDLTRPEQTLRNMHSTKKIFHSWGPNAQSSMGWSFPTQESLSIIPKEAVVMHRSKDGSLIARLRERRNNVSVPHKPAILSGIRRKVKALIRGGSTYYHSGNLGDICYSLYAIKAYGGGDLILGPKQNGTSPCSVPITKEQFDLFLPLLKQQKYLKHIEFSPAYPAGRIQFDLNLFRNDWNSWPLRQREGIHTLAKMHFHSLGITHLFNEDEAWLHVPDPIFHGQIVIHRSARYRSNDFPWSKLAARFHSQMLFVGHEAEWKTFCSDVCKNVAFWRITDFLQLARVIAGGKFYIGNQSFALSLAIGMGQNVLCEEFAPSPDCRFEREGYASQNKDIEKIEEWL